ncbi:MAG: ABC transporter permease [Pseudomonadales bacterium]
MFELDKWQEIFYTLKQNKLRTFLTAFGVFWGILMLILLLGAGTGMRHGVEKMFSSDLRDSIWFFGRQTSLPYKGLALNRDIQFTESDMVAIKRQLPGVKYVSAENPLGTFFEGDTVVTHHQKMGSFSVFGVADNYFKIKVYQDYNFGRRLNTFDSKENRKVATIGTRVAEVLFPSGDDPTGKYIAINGLSFRVVGVFYDSGWEGRMSERIYIPLEAFQKTFGHGEEISLITVAPKSGVDGFELEKQILRLLRERHRIAPEDQKALFSNNLAEEAQRISGLFTAINGFVWFVGIGTLMAGIVGISNIMIITVKERTREIGVRKALGATPWSIVSLILMESVMVTSVAGYLGLVIGVGLLEGTSYLLDVWNIELAIFERPEVDFDIAVTALLLLVSIGSVAGLVPALKAARITPVEAMRSE